MSDLTEAEVIDRLKSSLRECMDASKALATDSRRGKHYSALREHLKLVEGCCRQLGAFREDSRYFKLGLQMEECHKAAGGWLRGYRVNGIKIMVAPGQLNEMFVRLYINIEAILHGVEMMVVAKTGQRGPIVPEITQHRRIGRAVNGYNPSRGGVLMPPSRLN